MQVMEITRDSCPLCGKSSHVILFGDEVSQYINWYTYRSKLIQEAMPDTEPDVREFLRGSDLNRFEAYCNDCQETLFNRKSSGRIKDYECGLLEALDIEEIESKEMYDILKSEADELIAKADGMFSMLCLNTNVSDNMLNQYDVFDKSEHITIFKRKSA